ncbi:shikimate dehydrogenase [Acidocella sp.]|uniref:shikimate dehydrogenase n=1 Tax=Acidocella sp. TaxID=50710 RepID=UPI0025C0F61A|nr:shikimate dehydrogenase [Acidocella sp.]
MAHMNVPNRDEKTQSMSLANSVLVGLIGEGIGPSRSPFMHETEAAALGIKLIYRLIDLPVLGLDVSSLEVLLHAAELMGFSGVNVTHPCKQAVIPLLDGLSDEARALGAVNTVLFREGKRMGHNTDWFGFAEAFRLRMPGASLERVVQLGAGGAGAAVAYAILKMGAKHIVIVDVDPQRADDVVQKFSALFGADRISGAASAAEALIGATGLINATPIGMAAHPGLPLDSALLRPDLWVAEVVYFPLETALLKAAREIGCRTVDGGGMAVFQAAEAFRLFTGIVPDAARMLANFAAE